MGRKQVEFFNEPQPANGENRSGMSLVVTRKGVEIVGWYDTYVGIQPFDLSWEQIDAARLAVNMRSRRTAVAR